MLFNDVNLNIIKFSLSLSNIFLPQGAHTFFLFPSCPAAIPTLVPVIYLLFTGCSSIFTYRGKLHFSKFLWKRSKDILLHNISVIYRTSRCMGYAQFLRFFFLKPKNRFRGVCPTPHGSADLM